MPTVGSYGEGGSYERGTPVGFGGFRIGVMMEPAAKHFVEAVLLHRQPTGPSLLYHPDDYADRPRAMGV